MKVNFPLELLEQGTEEKMKYFREYKILHPFLKKAVIDTLRAIKSAGKETIIFVTGPPRVGKNELIARVIENLLEKAQPENKGIIPVVYTEAPSPFDRSFDWPDLFKRILDEMKEPLLDNKIEYRDIEFTDRFGQRLIQSIKKNTDLRRVLEKTLKKRCVSTLIINEAQHLLKVVNSRKLNWQLDVVKSLVNLSDTVHVLIGTYELLDFLEDLDLPAQLIGRTVTVNFPHYNHSSNEDVVIFKNVLNQLLSHIPVNQVQNDIANDWMYFYKHSIGCIGRLKEWMESALALALEDGEKVIKLEHFRETAMPSNRCASMFEEVMQGEIKYNNAYSEEKLDKLMGISSKKHTDDSQQEKTGSGRNNPKPDVRNPKRDKVGTEEGVS